MSSFCLPALVGASPCSQGTKNNRGTCCRTAVAASCKSVANVGTNCRSSLGLLKPTWRPTKLCVRDQHEISAAGALGSMAPNAQPPSLIGKFPLAHAASVKLMSRMVLQAALNCASYACAAEAVFFLAEIICWVWPAAAYLKKLCAICLGKPWSTRALRASAMLPSLSEALLRSSPRLSVPNCGATVRSYARCHPAARGCSPSTGVVEPAAPGTVRADELQKATTSAVCQRGTTSRPFSIVV